MKILVVAYACSPYRGSEAGVGWGWVKMIARNHEVTVITALRFRQDIARHCAKHGALGNVNFHYIRHDWSRVLDRIFPPYYLATYNIWLGKAYRLASQLAAKQGFDLCHLVTYVGFRHPGKFYKLDMPFVWGPIGGLENTPWSLLPLMGFGGSFYYAMRNLINSLDKRFLPLPKAAFRGASKRGAIIAATSSIQREIRKWYGVDSAVICEVGPPGSVVKGARNGRKKTEPMRICWSGDHAPNKALNILFMALKKAPETFGWHLDILGDGSCRKKWQRMAERTGLDERCTWHGRKPRDEAMSIMAGSNVFVITSLKDLTSSVLLEALSLGIPVVCPDHCGFSDVVDDSCGIKIPIADAGRIPGRFCEAIMALADDEDRRKKLSSGALKRAAEFSWENKSKLLEEIYKTVRG